VTNSATTSTSSLRRITSRAIVLSFPLLQLIHARRRSFTRKC
jgi:hypothetical protein